jgi:hypothetical protein
MIEWLDRLLLKPMGMSVPNFLALVCTPLCKVGKLDLGAVNRSDLMDGSGDRA